MTLKLTGSKAFGAVVLIVAVVGFLWARQSRALESQAAEPIKAHLAEEYSRHLFPVLEKVAQIPGVDPQQVARLTKTFSPDGIGIVSLRARGRSPDAVVKVEINVDGDRPPDAKRIRYFRMEHSTLTGWTLRREVSVWSYYFAF